MDPVSISVAATAVLLPYLAKAGESFAAKAGEKLGEKAGELYEAIKRKFSGDAYAEQTLARIEAKPGSAGAQSTLQELLEEKMQEDSSFAQAIQQLIQEVKAADTRNVLAIGERSVAVGGDVTGTIIAGDHPKSQP